MVAMQAIDMMISDAEQVEKKLTKKLDAMKTKIVNFRDMDKWNAVIVDLEKVNERLSTLYELRGKIGN